MGTDITICTEKKVDGKWVMIERIHSYSRDMHGADRNYMRFSHIANIRGYEREKYNIDLPTLEARGLPSDLSDSGKLFFEELGGICPSYMSLKEACEFWNKTEIYIQPNTFPHGFINTYPPEYYFGIYEEDLENEEWNDYRVVFWFN
ncbi:MAG: hypothetical protein A3E87_01710 [Gammaproteobacteria bacterium RIFCSPHIGHO2_12_FULL_35_23]|nr:MAG: hypothetical protein A3E87_01710 [Gammaproteobacteria bacterium RIFCSPHIGHO2_12_FULL_35_23]